MSKGPELFPIPNVKDLTVKDATKKLTDAGFNVNDTGLPKSLQTLYKVSDTNPSAGDMKPKGTYVTLYPYFAP